MMLWHDDFTKKDDEKGFHDLNRQNQSRNQKDSFRL